MTTDKQIRSQIEALLASQPLAVLSTQRQGQPYSSLMAFAYTDDLETIIVATGRSTRKHQNIDTEARVSLLVDNRSNSEDDFHQAAALTVIGVAGQVETGERPAYEALYLERHPYLKNFLAAPTTSLLKIAVRHYLLVTRFQSVMEYHLQDEVDLFS